MYKPGLVMENISGKIAEAGSLIYNNKDGFNGGIIEWFVSVRKSVDDSLLDTLWGVRDGVAIGGVNKWVPVYEEHK